MTSWYGNIFRITTPLRGASSAHGVQCMCSLLLAWTSRQTNHQSLWRWFKATWRSRGVIVMSIVVTVIQLSVSRYIKNNLHNMLYCLVLTHSGRVTHMCVSKRTTFGWDNGLSPGWRQAIMWTNAEILFIEPRGTNFSETLIEICTFSFKKMHLSRPQWVKYDRNIFCNNCCLSYNQAKVNHQYLLHSEVIT